MSDKIAGYLESDGRMDYVGKRGNIQDGLGKTIGRYRIVSGWKTPGSYVSTHYYQVEALIDGVLYTGRSAGAAMSWTGRKKSQQNVGEFS